MGSKVILALSSSTVFFSFLLDVHLYNVRLLALHSQCQVLLNFEGWNDVQCNNTVCLVVYEASFDS
jgi:hypothetical protein